MAKVKFILKEPTSKSDTLIYLIYNYQYKRFKYSTGEKISPKFWNENNQRVKESKKFPEYPEFNSRLDTLENGINNAFRRLLNDGIQPNNELLKKELEFELDDKVLKQRKKTLIEFIDIFIEDNKSIKQPSTITVYNTTLKHLKNYAEKKNKNIDFSSINLNFYSDFTKYLTQDLNMSTNTIGKYIKTIKTFLNEATERGLNTNLEFRKSKFKTISEETDTVYLAAEELKIIEEKDFSFNISLEKTRDLFLLGCYTGLRFSDFTQIKQENIIESKSIIQIRTQKTKEKVSIPIHPIVKRILIKYDNAIPNSFTNQVMNKYLKDIAELCEIDTPTELTTTKSGITQKSTVPKFKLITTHTARRSFATNCYLADIPSISIMKITGHKTEKSFLKYIKVTQEQNADKLLNHAFFK
ncbi:site-specific integrase [Lutibacter flavus]|uniref:Site-specific recombinase XerD n=1 Tax=Lutibacter flavus TaxID=691689 RepID=A0A238YX46_9FLAO|nr:site-specific integrase [Lutibacter flavus]SNR75532.1 Site-specific recombinase XerD [Lutibacter flavus]